MELSIISKIRSALKINSSDNGIYLSIANVLIERIDELDQISIISLSKEANVSPASITRFARKFGFNGWKSFIESLKRERSMLADQKVEHDEISTLSLYANRITNSIKDAAKENSNSIEEIALKLSNFKDCIYLFGIGANMDVIKIFSSELTALGFNVRFDSDYKNQIRLSQIVKENDLVFIFSYSMIGETIEKIYSNIQNNNCEIILFSRNRVNNNIFVNIPKNEAVHKKTHSKSSFAMLFLAYAIINNVIEINIEKKEKI